MKYDFTSILDRRGKDAAAYDNVVLHFNKWVTAIDVSLGALDGGKIQSPH